MKKIFRILLKILVGLVLLLIIIAFFSISRIDTTPYFQTEYYKKTIENIDQQIENEKVAEGKLMAGFASVNITPRIISGKDNPEKGEFSKIKLSGFGDGNYATGVHDSLFAKAIALKVQDQIIILASADLLMIPESLVEKIEEDLKSENSSITREQIVFGATHTHSSIGNSVPGLIGKSFGGDYNPGLISWLSKKYVKMINEAVADLKPAQFGSGNIHVPNLVRNRIIGETGRLNDKLTVVSVKQDSARQAAIGVFAAHATIIGTWNDQFSGDYPGYFQKSLEAQGIDMAMFFAGTVGSHTNKGKGDKFDKVKYVGQTLADSAKAVIDKLTYSGQAELTCIASEIKIPKLQMIYISDNLRLSPFAGGKLIPKLNSILLQGFKLNNLIWIAMPYELSGEYAIDLKNAIALKNYNSVFTSFNGQYLGYIVPPRYYYYDTYESRLMGWYGPSMGDYLMELNYKIANNLLHTRL